MIESMQFDDISNFVQFGPANEKTRAISRVLVYLMLACALLLILCVLYVSYENHVGFQDNSVEIVPVQRYAHPFADKSVAEDREQHIVRQKKILELLSTEPAKNLDLDQSLNQFKQ